MAQKDIATSPDGSASVTLVLVQGKAPTTKELLAAFELSELDWDVVSFKPNCWPTSFKDEKTGGIIQVTNWHLKATLVRKKPLSEPVWPAIRPAHFQSKPGQRGATHRSDDRTRQYVFWSDPHFGFSRPDWRGSELVPFHDRRALDLVEQIIRIVQPDGWVAGGDTLDLPDFSDKFLCSPEMRNLTQPALDEAAWWLARYSAAAPKAKRWKLEGNHDARMSKAIARNLAAAFGIRAAHERGMAPPPMSVPRLLGLDRLGIEWVGDYPNGEVRLGPVVMQHGDVVKGGSGNSARAVARDPGLTVFGHIHRQEYIVSASRSGQAAAVSPGCLCHVDGRCPGSKADQNWSQGLAVVTVHGEHVQCEPVLIRDGIALFRGTRLVGVNRSAQIVSELR